MKSVGFKNLDSLLSTWNDLSKAVGLIAGFVFLLGFCFRYMDENAHDVARAHHVCQKRFHIIYSFYIFDLFYIFISSAFCLSFVQCRTNKVETGYLLAVVFNCFVMIFL